MWIFFSHMKRSCLQVCANSDKHAIVIIKIIEYRNKTENKMDTKMNIIWSNNFKNLEYQTCEKTKQNARPIKLNQEHLWKQDVFVQHLAPYRHHLWFDALHYGHIVICLWVSGNEVPKEHTFDILGLYLATSSHTVKVKVDDTNRKFITQTDRQTRTKCSKLFRRQALDDNKKTKDNKLNRRTDLTDSGMSVQVWHKLCRPHRVFGNIKGHHHHITVDIIRHTH